MLIRFSKNPLMAAFGVVHYHKLNIALFILISFAAWFLHDYMGYTWMALPLLPVSVLGGALAIFLGFRNNSAYDRWWEARKIWGGIVNYSRTYGMEVNTFIGIKGNEELGAEEINTLKKSLIYDQIAWLYSLAARLRGMDEAPEVDKYLSESDKKELEGVVNRPQMILKIMGQKIKNILDRDIINDFQHIELMWVIKELYNLQGRAERIKFTVFPYYYNFFTRVFLWVFIIILPFSLISSMDLGVVPMSIAISFVFYILDQSGQVTEDPFENRAADTPMTTICRNIEIDLLNQMGQKDVPEPISPEQTRFHGLFIR